MATQLVRMQKQEGVRGTAANFHKRLLQRVPIRKQKNLLKKAAIYEYE